jgi:uroporphyrinogen-III synthase
VTGQDTRPHVLVTRPAERAEPLAARIAAQGWAPLLAPSLRTEPTGASLPELDGFDALVFTSAAGVRAFETASPLREQPAYAVGDATAEAARASGFTQVISAAGDVAALNALLASSPARRLLHVAGEAVAGEIAVAGREIERVGLYRTVAERSLPEPVRTALYARTVAAACFLSPRSAHAFISLVDPDLFAPVRALVLSRQVADALASVRWARIEIAARPTVDALLERLGAPKC